MLEFHSPQVKVEQCRQRGFLMASLKSVYTCLPFTPKSIGIKPFWAQEWERAMETEFHSGHSLLHWLVRAVEIGMKLGYPRNDHEFMHDISRMMMFVDK